MTDNIINFPGVGVKKENDAKLNLAYFMGTKKIIAQAYISKDFTGLEKEVVNGKHTFNNMYMLKTGRQQFYSIEDFINFLYTVIGFSDSVYTLSLDDLYNDDSIRYFIQKYYTN